MPGEGYRNLTVSKAVSDMLERLRAETGYKSVAKMLKAAEVVGNSLVVPPMEKAPEDSRHRHIVQGAGPT